MGYFGGGGGWTKNIFEAFLIPRVPTASVTMVLTARQAAWAPGDYNTRQQLLHSTVYKISILKSNEASTKPFR